MIIYLLWLLAVTSFNFSTSTIPVSKAEPQGNLLYSEIPSIKMPLNEIKALLQKEGTSLQPAVIDKVLTTIQCANAYQVDRNNILTIIDYSMPSNQKRLWVFDLDKKELLFHTYVSHGIKSGTLLTDKFSNKFDSKASSIGVYKTEQVYYGREGLSLRLVGLDTKFNDNAFNRYIVMHGGWYMDEQFIKRYGRPGRSWGCPALPLPIKKQIINTIKDNSLLVVYYPSDEWFNKSKFLNCSKQQSDQVVNNRLSETKAPVDDEIREDILFVDLNKNNSREEHEPIITMSADAYERIFHSQPPLSRMLRRQINNAEYIALSKEEFNKLVHQGNREGLGEIHFVIPVIIMEHGYYETQMQIVNMGKIKDVQPNSDTSRVTQEAAKSYRIDFESKPALNLKTTNRFIRWLGL
ncbi:TPA: murein L,D-transpeptidase catalytic domain family protein [Legionella pneumophila]